uniref:Nucleoside diphosphate kinase n=4 Tax=Hominidae TaxID=9604 RepID=A0A8I5SZ29_PONAB
GGVTWGARGTERGARGTERGTRGLGDAGGGALGDAGGRARDGVPGRRGRAGRARNTQEILPEAWAPRGFPAGSLSPSSARPGPPWRARGTRGAQRRRPPPGTERNPRPALPGARGPEPGASARGPPGRPSCRRAAAGGPSWTRERTLVAVKPDGVQRRLVGDVIQRFERRGFTLVGMKMLQAPESVLAEHYQDLRRKPFYPALIRYMSSGPVVAMVWEGYNVVRASRAMIGHTDSAEAAPGTIRGDFSVHISRNVIHASDSVEGAQREIQLWFQSSELPRGV